jgi:short subunit dehydrogenase-like uncharacterized protein
MAERFDLYGATGFTGKLILDRALSLGLRPTLAGRDAARLRSMAEPLESPWCAATVGDRPALDVVCRGSSVVLNAAGPFADTAHRRW